MIAEALAAVAAYELLELTDRFVATRAPARAPFPAWYSFDAAARIMVRPGPERLVVQAIALAFFFIAFLEHPTHPVVGAAALGAAVRFLVALVHGFVWPKLFSATTGRERSIGQRLFPLEQEHLNDGETYAMADDDARCVLDPSYKDFPRGQVNAGEGQLPAIYAFTPLRHPEKGSVQNVLGGRINLLTNVTSHGGYTKGDVLRLRSKPAGTCHQLGDTPSSPKDIVASAAKVEAEHAAWQKTVIDIQKMRRLVGKGSLKVIGFSAGVSPDVTLVAADGTEGQAVGGGLERLRIATSSAAGAPVLVIQIDGGNCMCSTVETLDRLFVREATGRRTRVTTTHRGLRRAWVHGGDGLVQRSRLVTPAPGADCAVCLGARIVRRSVVDLVLGRDVDRSLPRAGHPEGDLGERSWRRGHGLVVNEDHRELASRRLDAGAGHWLISSGVQRRPRGRCRAR